MSQSGVSCEYGHTRGGAPPYWQGRSHHVPLCLSPSASTHDPYNALERAIVAAFDTGSYTRNQVEMIYTNFTEKEEQRAGAGTRTFKP